MYYPVDSEVAAMTDLSAAAKLTHGYLIFIQREGAKSYPRVATVSKALGLRDKRTMQVIQELEETGLLKVTRRRGTSSLYRVQTTIENGTGAESDTGADIGTTPENHTSAKNGTGAEKGTGVVPKTAVDQSLKRQWGSPQNGSLPEFLSESLPESLPTPPYPPVIRRPDRRRQRGGMGIQRRQIGRGRSKSRWPGLACRPWASCGFSASRG